MDVFRALKSTSATLALASVITLSIPLAQADIDNGRYYITSRHSGLVLDVFERSTADGANVIQWEQAGSGSQNQQFDVNNLGNGYYSIRPAHSGKSLDLFNFSTEPGGDIRQWSWNGGPQQQWRIEPTGNGYHKIISRHSGMALDVWEWSRTNGGDIRQWPDSGGANQQWQFRSVPGGNPAPDPGNGGDNDVNACLASPVGYASLGGGTTGGAGGRSVTVRTGAEFVSALRNKGTDTPLVIRVDGTINLANSGGANKLDIKDVNNVSVIGVGNRGVLDGIGIKIWRANNIIVRNLTIRYVREGDGDGIGIQGPSNNVWIDHNTIHNSLNVDKDYYDGLVDVTRNANNISITYNHLHSSWKTSLTGHTDNNSENNRRITYAFNRWENVNSRTPLIRFSDTHLYNNYYNRIIDSGINSRMGAQTRIENNVFENSKNPVMSCYSNQIGYWDTRGNILNNITWQTGSGCVLAGNAMTPTTRFNPPYQYSLLPANQVRNHVLQNAGAGKCNL